MGQKSERGVVHCEECGAVCETASERILLAEEDLAQKRVKIAQLKKEGKDRLRMNKLYPQAVEVLEYWSHVCMPNAREILSEDRVTHVIARLRGGFTVDELKEAADGYGAFPYTSSKGRRPTGPKTHWHADAELIYRTPKHVQQGQALASKINPEQEDPATTSGHWELIPWEQVKYHNHKHIVQALTTSFGKGLHDDIERALHTDCPKCGGHLKVWDEGGVVCYGKWVGEEHTPNCNIDERQLLKMIANDQMPEPSFRSITRSGTAALGG